MIKSQQANGKNLGFTIVELLVVIVVIGILASITIVSYSGVTARANTAAGQSAASAAIAKSNVFAIDGPTGQFPATWGSLNNTSNTAYSITGLNFNRQGGNKTLTTFRPPSFANDTIDYQVCGTNTAAAATTYATVNVITGIRVGYWNYTGTPAEDFTQTAGTVSGSVNTYAVSCYTVGLAEATYAVARAVFAETGNYPATATIVNNGAAAAKMPAGVTALRDGTTLSLANGATTVKYECGTAVAATLPCLAGAAGGSRITYYDWQNNNTATLTIGTATNYAFPAS